MSKVFNTAAVCIPQKHYMVNIQDRLEEIKKLIEDGKYFTMNKARQYGKTTTLMALSEYLQKEYYVVLMDFQTLGGADYDTEYRFASSFASLFIEAFDAIGEDVTKEVLESLERLEDKCRDEMFSLRLLFRELRNICAVCEKPVVLMIDEVDRAADNRVFLDFLSQIRAQYIKRFQQPAFQSVILAGVYDIKNLQLKIRPEEEHKYNSPWNIASDFNVDMSFSKGDIAEMLEEYEEDYHTGMDVSDMAGLLYDYTSGYPFLVSRLCQLLDEVVSRKAGRSRRSAWTTEGFHEAVRMILTEKNTLFDSLIGKLHDYPSLNEMLRTLLFTGRTFSYSADEAVIDIASMFGFIKNQQGTVAVSNRIFETRLYNYYLSENEMQQTDMYKASLQEKNQFVTDGQLDMKKILERFVVHFHDIYGNHDERFLEEEGRQYFLLYLRPIINGIGNYYIEARTRNLRRTDVIIDYRGQQYVVEMKIWRGEEYHRRGEQQLTEYLDEYHLKKGYMLSFNFNKKKEIGVKTIHIQDKTIIEAVV